ncbi:hypothetical protein LB507_004122 [Fusarium sp. FIESC RH6]|nr:hypothetical protein LB507_004122 [Fusarium sp. FIESC RH6]
MHSLVKTFFWVILTWASLGLPLLCECQAPVKTGDYSHVREKLLLWDIYDTVTEIYGASKQKILLVQDPGNSWYQKRHVGSGPDGKLTYPEFMADLDQLFGKSGYTVDNTLQAPGSGPGSPSFVEASNQLISKNMRGIMKVEFLTPDKQNPKDYVRFVSMLGQAFDDVRAKFGDDPKWKSFLDEKHERSKKLLSEITSIRKQETDEWIKVQMIRDVQDAQTKKELYGLGLQATDLVTERVPTNIPGQTGTYERVKIAETWERNRNNRAFKTTLANANIKTGSDLVRWAKNLGKEGNIGPNSDVNRTHYESFQVWKTMYKRSVASPGGSGTCP